MLCSEDVSSEPRHAFAADVANRQAEIPVVHFEVIDIVAARALAPGAKSP